MAMNEKTKNVLSFLGRIVLSGFLLWLVFRQIDAQQTWTVVKSANLLYLFMSFLAFLVILVVLLFRLLIFIKAMDLSVSFFNVTRYHLVGLFGNLFLPSAVGGDIIKVVGLCRETPHRAKVVASILLDRLSGFAAIALVAVCAFLLGFHFIDNHFLLVPIVVIAFFSFGVAAVLFNEKIYSFVCSIFNRLPKVKNALMKLHYDISLLKDNKREGIKAIGLSCLNQVIFSFNYFLIAKALNQDINILYFLIFVPLICVVSTLPSLGGLGVREAGTAYLFSKIGIDAGVAVSMSLLIFLFMVITGLAGGLVYVSTLSSGRIQHHSPDVIADTQGSPTATL